VPVIGRMVGSTTVAEPGQPPLRPHSMKSSRCSGEDRRMSEPVESRDTAVFGKARHVGEDANRVLKASDVMSEAGRELEARSGQKPVAARSSFAMGLSFAMRCPTPLRKGERERAWIGSIVEGRLCGRLKMPLTCMSSSRFASRYQRVAMRADCGVRQALTSRRGASGPPAVRSVGRRAASALRAGSEESASPSWVVGFGLASFDIKKLKS
jgi:hypothetical protein